ncbi:hypothetical protein Pcinc_018943 [Petrolisthes cinctipes]|uniref:RAP domain-containing protein n=1 Tax=Petrolisthes cinctipes TaxID=88211 RepID=A0AAE1FMJ9_PETCI|nr:hypothetical protein Pcinc_018943 [Petrolisthes cinctipes]
MCAQRLWPSVQALGRGLVSSRGELFQQGVKAYNAQNFTNNHHTQGHPHNSFSGHENFHWSQRLSHNARGSFNKVVTRSLHSGTVLFVKEFSDSENEHAHAILRSLPAYHATTVTRGDTVNSGYHHQTHHFTDIEWNNCSAEEVANTFISMSQQCRHRPMDLEDSQYSGLCSVLAQSLRLLTDNQLISVLSALSLWPPTSATTTPNFVALWNSLDHTCTERIRKWDIARMFLVADHWFALRLSRISTYNIQMTKILGRQVTSMGPAQLVQFLFYANLSRKLEPFIIKRDIEKRLIDVLEHLSVEELGVISMGFFKTQTFLKSEKLIENIIKKTRESLEFVSDASLCAILKLLRKSVPALQWKLIYGLLDSLQRELHRLNYMCLLQVALLGNELLIFHPQVMDTIASRFAGDIKGLRLKDIERLTFALMLYNYVPPSRPDIFNLVAQELREPERVPEINHYPKCFVSCVVYLTTLGLFPQDLISAALQPSMLNLLSMSRHYSSMGREVNELDWTLEVEGPQNYKGYRLSPDKRAQLTQEYLGSLPSGPSKYLTHQEKLVLDVKDKLGAMLGGPRYLTITFVLPHIQTPDIVFCTNSDGEPVHIPDEYQTLPATSLKQPLHLDPDFKWNAVVIAGRNSFLRNTEDLRGNVEMKRRQLVKLGYQVTVVPYTRFYKRTVRGRLVCLEQVLAEGSSLATKGRVDSAMVQLKGLPDQQAEVVG